jgi:transposase
VNVADGTARSGDKQISLTDPDCRSMATSGRGSGMVAYDVQSAVDTTNHLIVAHEVTNVGTDRSQLATMAQAAKAALRSDNLDVVADRGYFKGEEILACEQAGAAVTLPKPQTSSAKSAGRFGKPDFVYWPRTTSIAARPARSWSTTSPLMKIARKCGFT